MEALDNLPYTVPEFMFFSRSADSVPGTGADESIHAADWGCYNELGRIKDWRKMLSNFYARSNPQYALFELDGKKWRSVEHYFHAQKFKESHPHLYAEFSLDSDSDLSRDGGLAAKRAGRSVKMSREDCAAWDGGLSKRALVLAQNAKFRQNPDLANVLCLTDGAILKHRASRFGALVTEHDLMTLRDKLITERN